MDQAHEELEVHFCNICNASIPESALRDGKAVRIDDKVLPTASGEIKAASGGGMLTGAFVVLVAVVAAAVFLDWRISQEGERQIGAVAAFGGQVERMTQRLDQIEARLARTVAAEDVDLLADQLGAFHETLERSSGDDEEALRRISEQGSALNEAIDLLRDEQVKLSARVAMLHEELRAVGQDLNQLKAAPRPAVAPAAPAPAAKAAAAPDDAAPGLPPEIARHAARLGDEDDGVRFDAVERLLDIGEPQVFPLILPLVDDQDLWVRRLVIEGLSHYQAAASVEALIAALDDGESIVRYEAHNSLTKLTGAEIDFDADGSRDQRAAGQRRWQQWWDRNRDSF